MKRNENMLVVATPEAIQQTSQHIDVARRRNDFLFDFFSYDGKDLRISHLEGILNLIKNKYPELPEFVMETLESVLTSKETYEQEFLLFCALYHEKDIQHFFITGNLFRDTSAVFNFLRNRVFNQLKAFLNLSGPLYDDTSDQVNYIKYDNECMKSFIQSLRTEYCATFSTI